MVRLKDIPETMLWTLYNRAAEALRRDGVIRDEKAIEIYKSIDYNYEQNFGKAEPSHALRSLVFDNEVRVFIEKYPEGVIVNLGEGLETQRFRIKDSKALWLSIDVPEAIEIREKFIRPDSSHIHLPVSALDRSWFDSVPRGRPVFITAQGLFMYFEEKDVKSLMQDIFNRFKVCCLMFDTIPEWLSKKTMSEKGWKKTESYTTPQMPWGFNRGKIGSIFKNWLTEDVEITDMGYPVFPRGITRWLFFLFSSTPVLKNVTPSIIKICLPAGKPHS